MRGSVLTVSSRALLDACARLGLDTTRILEAAHLDPAVLQNPDARISTSQVDLLWREAYELSNDPDLALHAIEVLPFGAYRVIDFLAASAPTVGAALAKVSDYFALVNGTVRLTHAARGREITFALESSSRASSITRPYAEYTLAAVFLRTRIATNRRYPLRRVEFCYERPADISEHERLFECPVRFGAPRCQMVIGRDVWDTPSAGSDPVLFSVLDAHARMLLERLPRTDDLIARVRDAIRAELGGGTPALESVAKRLATSPRSLQRRLAKHGVLFNHLLDDMRFDAAKAYLAERDLAAAEVAFLLGFAEQSSFNRAFKRWSGQTPIEYRRRLSAD